MPKPKMPSIPTVLVELGRAVELDSDKWTWTWNTRDNWIVAATADGKRLFLFARPKKTKNPDEEMSERIQSYLFAKHVFLPRHAKQWLIRHNLKAPTEQDIPNWWRYQQEPESHFRKGSLRTKILSLRGDIQTIVGAPLKKWATNPGYVKRGERLYKIFNRRESDELLRGNVSELKQRAGIALHVVYHSDKFGPARDYIHRFDAGPTVWVDNPSKPRIIGLIGGKIRITKRGIEG